MKWDHLRHLTRLKESLEFAMRAVTLLDTAVASTNLGDQIIMEAVRAELAGVLSDAMVYSVARALSANPESLKGFPISG